MTAALLLWLFACSGDADLAGEPIVAHDIGDAECAVCGMFVSQQPTPRGQAVYRDGTHHFLCSIEELRATVQTRSPLGQPVAVFVEALPADFDPSSTSIDPLPWTPAEDASFVYGATRPLVMGTPVLSFSDADAAAQQAQRLQSNPVTWQSLVYTPFGTVPSSPDGPLRR